MTRAYTRRIEPANLRDLPSVLDTQQTANVLRVSVERVRELANSGELARLDYSSDFLYGFVSADESSIVRYFIGDLEVFRKNEPTPKGPFQNDPPDSTLVAYKVSACPDGFIVKSWPGDWAGAR